MTSRRERDPVKVYLLLTGGYAFLLTMVVSVNLVFQTQQAGLNPLQLVLVGTALEATIFLGEMPTGVIADVYGRRISVIIGLCVLGCGMMITGVFARFETIILGQLVWGVGYTFVSGAQQAWIADEVGVEAVGSVYLRGTQVEQFCRIAAIPISIGIATQGLNLPILIGGGAFIGLGLLMALLMTEQGFTPPPRDQAGISMSDLTGTFIAGGRLVRQSPLLITVFGIAAFYGMASEGFDRLWVSQFYHNLGFPAVGHFQPVVWFGVIRMGSALLSVGFVEVVRKRINFSSHVMVSKGLFLINLMQIASLLLFAASGSFVMGMIVFWTAVSLSRMYDPLYLAWINQSIDSRVRATVISMSSQTDAIGQIAGGPMIGAIGTLISLRAALFATGAVLSPALLLYTRAFRQGRPDPAPEAGPARS